ncbi:MAG: DNRLRE domain-containing protein [Saprospiraceae bacterium]|nr:DNRLRE domain-containing protein [Saprospiraceae bacterium]
MKWNPSSILLICLVTTNGNTQALGQVPHDQAPHRNDCIKSVFVESPIADTYITSAEDTVSYGNETILKVKGLPAHKQMSALLSYEVHHLDANYLQKAYLKVYTASKDRGNHLELFSVGEQISEVKTNWKNQPAPQQLLDRKPITDASFITFEITDFVQRHLQDGYLNFNLISDSKKVIDIASRESGLSAELVMEMCTSTDPALVELTKQESRLRVLPSTLNGKMTIQLFKVPAGGFGELMIMTEQGDIFYQIPLSIQDAEISYHTVDFRGLIPGVYWAVLRKGRVMIKDQFRLKPENGSTLLKIDHAFVAETVH